MIARLLLAALLAACIDPAPTRWEAARAIAASHCAAERPGDPTCEPSVVAGWCRDAEDCAEPIEDQELLDRCIAELTGECWWLFRDEEDRNG